MNRSTARRLVRVAAEEVERAREQIRVPGHPRPYYISCVIRDEEQRRLQARFGALVVDSHDRHRNAFVDVRVGSYRNDQVRDGGLHDNDKDCESYDYVELPFGDATDALRHGLWRLIDARYREALEALLDKRSHEITYKNQHHHLKAFERRKPTVDLSMAPLPEFDRDHWARYVERASALMKRHPEVRSGHIDFEAAHVCRVFVNSEGTRLIQSLPIWSLECNMWLLSDKGDGIPWSHKHIVADPDELPGEKRFHAEIREAVERMRRLAGAPTLRSFIGPALLDPVPAGLMMHEAVGHRLEGNRLLADGEGQTFRDALGDLVLPEFLSLRDDPTRARYGGRSLVGHYRYDDEGVAATDTTLVKQGRLVDFLASRTGIRPRHRSSGHARTSYHQRPISRMGVTIVESSNGLDDDGMRQRLLEEIRRQKAPFGIRVMDATSGETATDAYNFQAFLGEVNLATKVYPDGREEWIRGVNFVGTPLNAVRSIIAAGNRYEVDNAFCGAESGYLPVSTISPALLVSDLELQAKADSPYTPYTFPMPW